MNQGIILNSKQSLKERKENYTMKKSLSKKAKKVIEEGVQEFMELPPLAELTRIGARMMLQSALEEEVTAYLHRDYYERITGPKESERVNRQDGEDRQRRHWDMDAAGEERRRAVSFHNTTASRNPDG